MWERSERRRFFRIDDFVGLTYRPLDENERYGKVVRHEAENIQIIAAQVLKTIDRELVAAMDTMWKANPAVANVVGLINKKIDILVSEMDLDYAKTNDGPQTLTAVSLSACGMAFECEDQFSLGQLLAVDLILRPSGTRLEISARVVACEPTMEGSAKPYLLRIDFDQPDASTEEELIQHVVRRQSYLLGKQRAEITE